MLRALIDVEHLVYIDLSYVCDNVSPPWSGVKSLVDLMLLASGKSGDASGGNLMRHTLFSSGSDWIHFRMKIRTDRKCLTSADFSKRWFA